MKTPIYLHCIRWRSRTRLRFCRCVCKCPKTGASRSSYDWNSKEGTTKTRNLRNRRITEGTQQYFAPSPYAQYNETHCLRHINHIWFGSTMHDQFLACFLGTCLFLINFTLHTTCHCLSEFIPTLAYTYKPMWQICLFNTRLLNISQVQSNFMLACTLRVLFSFALPEGYLMTLFKLWRTKRNKEINQKQHSPDGIVSFTFMWPCIVTNFFIIKPTRCTDFTNLFWHDTLHVSDSSPVHHQEFIHCTLSNGICHTGL